MVLHFEPCWNAQIPQRFTTGPDSKRSTLTDQSLQRKRQSSQTNLKSNSTNHRRKRHRSGQTQRVSRDSPAEETPSKSQ